MESGYSGVGIGTGIQKLGEFEERLGIWWGRRGKSRIGNWILEMAIY